MKAKFKPSWISSSQPRKQRKFAANAPFHLASQLLNASLSKELRTKHKRRTLRVRSGDEVQVMRGHYKGEKGLVDSVDIKRKKLVVRGIEILKRDGSKRPYPIAVSNVRITKLTDDKRRL